MSLVQRKVELGWNTGENTPFKSHNVMLAFEKIGPISVGIIYNVLRFVMKSTSHRPDPQYRTSNFLHRTAEHLDSLKKVSSVKLSWKT